MALAGGVSDRRPAAVRGYLYQDGGDRSRPTATAAPSTPRPRARSAAAASASWCCKRLADALADGDPIHAVDPRLGHQQRRRAQGRLSPRRASTGQARGDRRGAGRGRRRPGHASATSRRTAPARRWAIPIEIAALTQAFRQATDAHAASARIGSVKTQHRPPRRGGRRRRPDQDRAGAASTARCRRACTSSAPNPAIDFAGSPFFVNAAARGPGRREATPRRAGVSSFGIGGTNAHVVLEEAPAAASPRRRRARGSSLLLSGADRDAPLDAATPEPGRAPASRPSCRPGRRRLHAAGRPAGASAIAGRSSCRDAADAVAALRVPAAERVPAAAPTLARPAPVRLPVPRPGRAVRRHGRASCTRPSPSSARPIDECAELPRARSSASTCGDSLYPGPAAEDAAPPAGARPALVAQPALFAVEYALARLWMGWGVRPDGDDRPQHRRVRGRLPGRRLLAGGRAGAGRARAAG